MESIVLFKVALWKQAGAIVAIRSLMCRGHHIIDVLVVEYFIYKVLFVWVVFFRGVRDQEQDGKHSTLQRCSLEARRPHRGHHIMKLWSKVGSGMCQRQVCMHRFHEASHGSQTSPVVLQQF